MRHVRNCVSAQRRTLPSWAARGPGRIRGRCTALRDHDPVHHVIPRTHPITTTGCWRATQTSGKRAQPRNLLIRQGLTVTYGELELIGLQHNPPFVMQDPGAHRVPETGVTRIHPRQVEAVEPKVREFVVDRIEGLRSNGGGTSSQNCSNRCRRWWWRITSGARRTPGTSSICGPIAIVAANTATRSLTQNLAGVGDTRSDR